MPAVKQTGGGGSARLGGLQLFVQQPPALLNLNTAIIQKTARAAFTPLELFAGGVQGGWYDPSDLASMWQDSAGTTPAVVDSPVGRIDDKSGNGNHLIQATSGARPILRNSGTAYYLEFDGSDDFLAAASFPITDGSGHHFTAASLKPASTPATALIFSADGSPRVSQLIRTDSGTPGTYAFDTGGTPYFDSAAAISTTNVVLSQLTASSTTEMFKDGVGNGPTAIGGTMQTGSVALYLGAYNGGAAFFYPGRFYGGLHLSRAATINEHAQVVAYLTVPVAYSLAADIGSYSLSGTAVGLKISRSLTLVPGSYALTGTATSLRIARRQVESVGSYSITGTATNLRIARRLVEAVGSYNITGTATALRVARKLAEASGSYSITGTATGLKSGRQLATSPGAYVYSGTAVTLTYTPASIGGNILTATPGSYSIAGSTVQLIRGRRLNIASGSYLLQGYEVQLIHDAIWAAADPVAGTWVGPDPIEATWTPETVTDPIWVNQSQSVPNWETQDGNL